MSSKMSPGGRPAVAGIVIVKLSEVKSTSVRVHRNYDAYTHITWDKIVI